MGNRVTVLTTSQDKAEFAHQLGADDAIVLSPGTALPPPKRKFDILLNTAPADYNWAEFLDYVETDGVFSFVAASSKPLEIPIFKLITTRIKITGSPIGGRARMVEMLQLADKFSVKPVVETFKMSQINEAFQKVRENKVRYRAVLYP